jgi:hypothetical protein
VAHNIEQLQDEVAEITTEQWPACPEHNHELRPAAHGSSFAWVCDRSGAVVATVGSLLRTDRAEEGSALPGSSSMCPKKASH